MELAKSEPAHFENHKYAVLNGILPKELLEVMHRYALFNLTLDGYFDYDQESSSLGRYADAFGEAMLIQLQPVLEQVTKKTLLPTYSFLRFYSSESTLHKHVDRNACEISATLTVGHNADATWPIFLEVGGRPLPVYLDIGDILIYRGMDLPHWRERLSKGSWLQLFIHYVDANGPYTDQHYDARGKVGPNLWWSTGSQPELQTA